MNLAYPLGGLILATAMTLPVAEAAEPSFVSCHRCSDSQARRAAEGAIPMTHPPGAYEVYVADAPGNKLRAFRVAAEREPGFSMNFGTPMTPAKRLAREFKTARSEWAYVRKGTASGIEIEAGFPVDHAEQVIGSAVNQRIISEQINQHWPARVGSLFGSALMLFRQIFTAEILIEVRFPEGSTALFVLTRVDSITSGHMFVYRYKKGSARDSEGNAIPDSPESLANFRGDYWSETNFERFKRRAERYGAQFDERLRNHDFMPAHTVCAWDNRDNILCWHN
jgi:hypothetical protein